MYELAVNVTGDSDSIACIAGGIVGTRNGFEMINVEWINKLRDGWILKDFVKPLLKMKKMLKKSSI
ncbi:MAG: ADP-ribosylglycohydrolase family protein [Candidatus Heimdallarchaeota archaeon]|nr:ADP-ribosylglycohydrolase family protein [Candidatus Heimdallarchaeota archaeon]